MTASPNMAWSLPAFLASTVSLPDYTVLELGSSTVGIAVMPPPRYLNQFRAIALSGGHESDETTYRYVSDSHYSLSYYGGMPYFCRRINRNFFDASVVKARGNRRQPALINVNVHHLAGSSYHDFLENATLAALTIAAEEGLDSIVFPIQFGRSQYNGIIVPEGQVVVRTMLAGIQAFLEDMHEEDINDNNIHSILICIRDKTTLEMLRLLFGN